MSMPAGGCGVHVLVFEGAGEMQHTRKALLGALGARLALPLPLCGVGVAACASQPQAGC